MPSPREQPRPDRKSRRQDTMPGGWLWVVVLLLLGVVLFITFGFQSASSIDYSDFIKLVEDDKNQPVAKVIFSEGSTSLTAEFDPSKEDKLPKEIKDKIRNHRVEVVLWKGDVDSGELSKLLQAKHISRKTERQVSVWLGTLSIVLTTLLFVAIFFFFFILPRFRDPFGSTFLNNYIRSPAKRFDKTKMRTTFDDVADMTNAKFELQEIVDFLKSPEKFQKLGAQIPKGVLLVGPPGTGKTLLARAVAGEAGVPFFSISGSEFIQMFVGVGASRVRDMFRTAKENAPCILFIDEIDAVGRMRGTGVGGGSDEREQTLNQILTEMDGFSPNESVIVLAATNRPDVLDPALLRPGRFDRHVTVDRPTRKGRFDILKVHTRNIPLDPDVDLDSIARGTVGMSGADLANLVNEAALLATRENKDKVDMRDFDAARDKIIMWAKREDIITEKEKRLTAYHEVGHALVAWLIPEADPVHKVTIIPRGRSLGMTQYLPTEDRLSYYENDIRAMLAVGLGGRAAERLAFDVLSAGVADDLKKATRLARLMVKQFGMSEPLGPVFFRQSEEPPFLGREIGEPGDHFEHPAQIIDEEVARIIREADERAYHLLEEHRDELERLTEALIEREVLTVSEIEELIGKRAGAPAEAAGDEIAASIDNPV